MRHCNVSKKYRIIADIKVLLIKLSLFDLHWMLLFLTTYWFTVNHLFKPVVAVGNIQCCNKTNPQSNTKEFIFYPSAKGWDSYGKLWLLDTSYWKGVALDTCRATCNSTAWRTVRLLHKSFTTTFYVCYDGLYLSSQVHPLRYIWYLVCQRQIWRVKRRKYIPPHLIPVSGTQVSYHDELCKPLHLYKLGRISRRVMTITRPIYVRIHVMTSCR